MNACLEDRLQAIAAAGPATPLTLSDAVLLPEIELGFSTKILRTAIEKGRLEGERHGRTYYTTRRAIAAWRAAARVKPTVTSPAPIPSRQPVTSDRKAALAALDRISRNAKAAQQPANH